MADRVRGAGEHPVAYGVNTGRFSADRADVWAVRYIEDPAGTTALIASLAPVLGPPAGARAFVASLPVTAPEAEQAFLRALTSPTDVGSAPTDAELRAAGIFPPTTEEFDRAQAARVAKVAAMSDEELEAELFGPGA